jgi:hypothetical protein
MTGPAITSPASEPRNYSFAPFRSATLSSSWMSRARASSIRMASPSLPTCSCVDVSFQPARRPSQNAAAPSFVPDVSPFVAMSYSDDATLAFAFANPVSTSSAKYFRSVLVSMRSPVSGFLMRRAISSCGIP